MDDIPKILEHLNDIHQNEYERDEIVHFGEDLRSLITESSKSFYSINPENNMISRVNNLLQKQGCHQELDLFSMLVKNMNSVKLNVNIPTTMLRTDHNLYFIQYKKDKKSVQVRECTKDEFFNLTTTKNDPGFPSFIYKVPEKNKFVLFTTDSAIKTWNLSEEDAQIQHFVQSKTNPATITRVLWRLGMKTKYFTITNRKKAFVRSNKKSSTLVSSLSAKRCKMMNNISSDFKYSNMILPTSQSVNNPFKGRMVTKLKTLTTIKEDPKDDENKIFKTYSTTLLPKVKDEIDSPLTMASEFNAKERNKDYLVLTKDIESCYASESYMKIFEIEYMVEQLIEFLNSEAFKYRAIKGIVLDFIKDKSNNWFLLDCKDYCTECHMNLECDTSKKIRGKLEKEKTLATASDIVDSPSLSQQDLDLPTPSTEDVKAESEGEAEVEDYDPTSEITACPFKIRSKPKKIDFNAVTEKQFIERLNKVNEKIDRINQLKTPTCITPVSKEESIKEYCKSFHYTFTELNGSNANSPKLKCPMNFGNSEPDTSSSEDKDLIYTRNVVMAGVDNYDEMAMNIKISKIKQQDIVKKYGGKDFWSKFIVSLYNKILATPLLNRHFASSTIESFEKIVEGMFKIVSAKINLELRRKLKQSHHVKGITYEEFNCYTDLFELTLTEFNVDEEDKAGIMSEVKLMKSLICRKPS
ncbi:unnamed protein product [Blepharisma stoltei]|uniref:Uncharacterized protein n=1 Tax=Blepharisma stoltei TaxID=1481888 RepID=A0AAU9K2S5_9CILI|nr:unnamed protein product [Blepharisma stoltei]